MVPTLLALLAFLIVNVTPNGLITHTRPTVRVELRVERQVDNRSIVLEVVGDDYYSRSDWDLEGDHAPYLFTKEFRDLPQGEYDVAATLVKSNHSTSMVKGRHFTVVN